MAATYAPPATAAVAEGVLNGPALYPQDIMKPESTNATEIPPISRRSMLGQTGLLGATLVAGLPPAAAVGLSFAGEPPKVKRNLKIVVATRAVR
jgi:hypothetical protein